MLANFLRLGINRYTCSTWLLIASTALYAQSSCNWDSTDSQNLAHINYLLSNPGYGIYDSVNSIREFSYGSFNALCIISNVLNDVNSKLVVDTVHHLGENDYTDALMVHDVRTDDIYSYLLTLNDSINNLTNYLCYSPEYAAGAAAIYTNFPALFAYIDGITSGSDSAYRVLWRLLGREPTYDEYTTFYHASSSGISKWVSYLLNYGYSWGDLPEDLQELSYDIPYYNNHPYALSEDALDAFTHLRYYQYGTRDLTDTGYVITNQLSEIISLINSFTNGYSISAIEVENDRPGFSSSFRTAVGSLASSFEPNVNTNVASISTNAIADRPDSGYIDAYDALKDSHPLADESEGIIDFAGDYSAFEDFANSLQASGNSVSFSFDLTGLNDSVHVIPLPSLKASASPIFTFIFRFLQACVFIYTCIKTWNLVVGVNFMRR